jgi:hypothetical protein
MKRVIISCVLWLGLWIPESHGAKVASERDEELAGIIAKALEANPELKALESEFAMSRAQIGPVGSLEDPMLGFEVMNVPTDSFRMNEFEMSGLQISLAQKLSYPGKRDPQREIAALRSHILEHRIQQMKLNIGWTIKRIYYELYLHGAVKRIRPKMMTVKAAFMGLVPIMWSMGTGSDVMKRIAAPMVGGLVTSFALELVIYPVLYFIWKSKFVMKKAQSSFIA